MTKGNEIRDVVDGAHGVKKVCPNDMCGTICVGCLYQQCDTKPSECNEHEKMTCPTCKGSGEVGE